MHSDRNPDDFVNMVLVRSATMSLLDALGWQLAPVEAHTSPITKAEADGRTLALDKLLAAEMRRLKSEVADLTEREAGQRKRCEERDLRIAELKQKSEDYAEHLRVSREEEDKWKRQAAAESRKIGEVQKSYEEILDGYRKRLQQIRETVGGSI